MSAAAIEIQQVTDDLIFWQAYEPEVKVDLCSCAVRGSKGWVIIDPIPLANGAIRELSEVIEPASIVLTNGNHPRAATEYRDRFGVPVFAHGDAVPELEVAVDNEIQEGSIVAGDIAVVAIPGAGVGEIALLSPRGSLHLGDALINLEPYGFSFLPEKYCRDAKEMRRSLAKLTSLNFTVVTFAHGLPLVTQAKARLSQLLA